MGYRDKWCHVGPQNQRPLVSLTRHLTENVVVHGNHPTPIPQKLLALSRHADRARRSVRQFNAKASSSRFNCIDTADCIRFSKPAALVTPPISATATHERKAVRSRIPSISISLMIDVKNIHFTNSMRRGKHIRLGDASEATNHI